MLQYLKINLLNEAEFEKVVNILESYTATVYTGPPREGWGFTSTRVFDLFWGFFYLLADNKPLQNKRIYKMYFSSLFF